MILDHMDNEWQFVEVYQLLTGLMYSAMNSHVLDIMRDIFGPNYTPSPETLDNAMEDVLARLIDNMKEQEHTRRGLA